MALDTFTRLELIFPDLSGADRHGILKELAGRIAETDLRIDGDELFRALVEREALGSTGLGGGVAVPHCKMKRLDRVVLAVGLCPDGVDFEAVDGQPVRVLFVVISPSGEPAAHLRSLAAISRWVSADHHVERLLERQDPAKILELLGEVPAE